MSGHSRATVLFVPGLRDHVPGHWQSVLQAQLPAAECVPRLGSNVLSCEAWVSALDRSIAAIEGPIVLVAHSAGVMMVAHWAGRHSRPIRGALLATPPDFDSALPEGYPDPETLRAAGWLPTPRAPLPFPSIVAASRNDPLARVEKVAQLARDWGSRLFDAGEVGHLNPASGFGPWAASFARVGELVGA